MSAADDLFPETTISTWLDEHDIASGSPLRYERLAGGRSNVMFRIERGGRRLVLRRPAKVAVAKADDGMRREFRMLRALDATAVPHPASVALCDDPTRIGCVFYVMEAVEGINPVNLPASLGPPTAAGHDVTMALTDALALLHDVDWRAVGLGDFGRPDGFHERQVSRWTKQYDSYQGRLIPEVATVGAWLERHRPTEWSPSIMHADYHMYNVLIATDPPARVTAIVDWETATIGDPLLDLAGFVEVWCNSSRPATWPSRRDVVERYAHRRRLMDVPDLRYYEVLYNFRLGVLLEGIYQRSLRDDSRDDDQVADVQALRNFARAGELAGD